MAVLLAQNGGRDAVFRGIGTDPLGVEPAETSTGASRSHHRNPVGRDRALVALWLSGACAAVRVDPSRRDRGFRADLVAVRSESSSRSGKPAGVGDRGRAAYHFRTGADR